MPETPGNGSTKPVPPDVFALATPRKARSYDEPSQEETVGDIRNLLSELKNTFKELAVRIEAQEKSAAETKDLLRQLAPKIEDVAGFVKHRSPMLTEKADLIQLEADLRKEIEKRPTRRQAIFDLAWVFGLIVTAITLGSRLAH